MSSNPRAYSKSFGPQVKQKYAQLFFSAFLCLEQGHEVGKKGPTTGIMRE